MKIYPLGQARSGSNKGEKREKNHIKVIQQQMQRSNPNRSSLPLENTTEAHLAKQPSLPVTDWRCAQECPHPCLTWADFNPQDNITMKTSKLCWRENYASLCGQNKCVNANAESQLMHLETMSCHVDITAKPPWAIWAETVSTNYYKKPANLSKWPAVMPWLTKNQKAW